MAFEDSLIRVLLCAPTPRTKPRAVLTRARSRSIVAGSIRPPELQFEFVARYELTVLDRVQRSLGIERVLGFPGAFAVDPQRELSAGVVLAVRPAHGEPWIGVFELADRPHPAWVTRQVIGWPDERSICVVHAGAGCIVRTDDPTIEKEIECGSIADVLVVPDLELIVFADDVSLVAYGKDGLVWATGRLFTTTSRSCGPTVPCSS